MKHKLFIYFNIALLFIFSSCTDAQTQYQLDANQFYTQLGNTASATLIDVRSPQEFFGGHLPNAQNINWNDDTFSDKIAKIEKSKPVFVYCLSGGRSSSAAREMRKAGFKEVFELSGGMMAWRANNLPETGTSVANNGTSITQYNETIKNNPKLLINFYADWCAPCQKMKPFIEQLKDDSSLNLKIVKLDADLNKGLCKQLGIVNIPTLIFYESGKEIWKHEGAITKQELLNKLKK